MATKVGLVFTMCEMDIGWGKWNKCWLDGQLGVGWVCVRGSVGGLYERIFICFLDVDVL